MIHAEMMTADSGQRVLIVRGASSEDRVVPWSAVHRISDLDSITAALRRHSPNATAPEWHETASWDLDWLHGRDDL